MGDPQKNTDKMAHSVPAHLWEALRPNKQFSCWVKGRTDNWVGEQLNLPSSGQLSPPLACFVHFWLAEMYIVCVWGGEGVGVVYLTQGPSRSQEWQVGLNGGLSR